VRLAHLDGLSREDLAARFGHPSGTITTWLHRSMKQLEDIDALAAEFVIDTLDARERVEVVARRLRYADTEAAKGKSPRVTAGAYTNSFAGTKATTLYDIEGAAGTLLRQVPPNDGILTRSAALG